MDDVYNSFIYKYCGRSEHSVVYVPIDKDGQIGFRTDVLERNKSFTKGLEISNYDMTDNYVLIDKHGVTHLYLYKISAVLK